MRLKITPLLFLITCALFTVPKIYAQCSGANFEEKNGIAVLEMESASSLPSAWKKETGTSGYTGSSFLAYRGSNYFGSPGNNKITYKVKINSAGTYKFQWRNRVGIGSDGTEHNDSWLRFPDAYDFYGKSGSTIKYPKGGKYRKSNLTVNGSSGGGWMKIYKNGGTGWGFQTKTSDHESLDVYAQFTSAGVYTIEVSGRSQGHFIDRMVLYKESSYSESSATSTSRGETKCDGTSSGGGGGDTGGGDTGGSTPNENPTVSITSPTNGQNFTAGANVAVKLSANDSDGSIVKHEIFVNGSKVDTDGSTYSTYSISGIAEGSYAIKAVVTDNDGATASTTINITVGSGNTGGGSGGGDTGGGSTENQNPTVAITSPTNGQSVAAGSNVSVKLSANDSDGSIVKHEIYVNGSKVDTDGSNYTPHPINNVTAGTYTVRAVVTDNDGAKGENTISFTVGGSTGGGDTGGGDTTPPSSGDGSITSLQLMNANSDTAISTLTDGMEISLEATGNVPMTVVAQATSSVSAVKFSLSGPLSASRYEGSDPYALFGDIGVNLTGKTFPVGNYVLKVTPVLNGTNGADVVVNFKVVSSGSGDTGSGNDGGTSSGGITFDLINSSTDQVISSLSNGGTVNNGANINFKANSSFSGTKSVYLVLNGTTNRSRVENVAPYTLFGDSNGNYFNGSLPVGSYSLTATAYSGTNLSGTVLGTKKISFTVASSSGLAFSNEVVASAYPNPVPASTVSLRLPEEVAGEVQYSIINTLGMEMEAGKSTVETAGEDLTIYLNSFNTAPEGIYYVRVKTANGSYTVPLIKK